MAARCVGSYSHCVVLYGVTGLSAFHNLVSPPRGVAIKAQMKREEAMPGGGGVSSTAEKKDITQKFIALWNCEMDIPQAARGMVKRCQRTEPQLCVRTLRLRSEASSLKKLPRHQMHSRSFVSIAR